MRSQTLFICAAMAMASGCASVGSPRPTSAPTDFHAWAKTPPMGWNSWDAFATTLTEEQAKAQAAFMATHLKPHGWQYIVVDIQWYEPHAKGHEYRSDAVHTLDGFGRFLPAPNRFPSSANGVGFKALADHVHGLGLKFGIHLMRGIPRQAVEKNLPIFGTEWRARDIADTVHVCLWNPDMYGVDMSKPGAQAYYDSVFAQFAAWGVDYVKVDDLSRPYFQNLPEVEAIRRAIDKTGRPMVLSLSPGATDLKAAGHVAAHANLWRISDDFWDRWLSLKDQFWRLAAWNPHRRPGAWPDADMLPLGTLVLGQRTTRFTPDEQILLMSLWAIARSPLMHGGDLTKTDAFTLSLLTNDEVLAVNQHSDGNRPLWERDGIVAWTASDPKNRDRYLAAFNARDRVRLDAGNARGPEVFVSSAPGKDQAIDADLSGGRKLFLSAMPVTESDWFSTVRWKNPRLVFADGREAPLGNTPWTKADAQWDSAVWKKGEGSAPGELRAQASAVIEYAIPAGATRFLATVHSDRPEHATADSTVRVLTVVGTETNEDTRAAIPVEVSLADLDIRAGAAVRDLWSHRDLGVANGTVTLDVPFHGARLVRLSPK